MGTNQLHVDKRERFLNSVWFGQESGRSWLWRKALVNASEGWSLLYTGAHSRAVAFGLIRQPTKSAAPTLANRRSVHATKVG